MRFHSPYGFTEIALARGECSFRSGTLVVCNANQHSREDKVSGNVPRSRFDLPILRHC